MNDLDLFPSSLLLHPLKVKSPSSVQMGLDQDLKDAQKSILVLRSSITEAESKLLQATKLLQTSTHLLSMTQQSKDKAFAAFEEKNINPVLSLESLESLYHPVQVAEEQYQKALLLYQSYRGEITVTKQEVEELQHSLKVQELLMDNTKLLSKMLKTKVSLPKAVIF